MYSITVIILLSLIFCRLETLRISPAVLSRSFARRLLPPIRKGVLSSSKAALNPKAQRSIIPPRYYTVPNRDGVQSRRSILRVRWTVTFLNSRLKRGETPPGWEAQREMDFIFSPGDIIARNYFLSPADQWGRARANDGEIAPRLALISSVAISLGPAPSGPPRKLRRERGGSPPRSRFFFLHFSLRSSLFLPPDTNLRWFWQKRIR